MPQARRSDTQRPQTAPASHRTSSSLDLGSLHQALPRTPVLSHQNSTSGSPFSSAPSTPRHQANGPQATRPLPFRQRRTTKRPSTTEGSRRAPTSSPKGPSTPEGSRVISAPARWERPTLAESNKLFSDPGKGPLRPGDSQTLAGRKGFGDVNKLTEQDGIVWKTMYLKWWHSFEVPESLDPETIEETQMPPHDTRIPPEGFVSWRSAFMARFQEGKKQLTVREKAFALSEGYLRIRRVPDTYGKRVYNCVQGDGMQKLADHLGLSFSVCLNRGRHFKIEGKGKIDIFQNSCVLRYPVALIGNLNLFGLKSVEVTATSDRLLRVCPIVDFHCITPGVSVIVGTLVEKMIDGDEANGTEQVLLIVLSIHLNNLLWKLLDLGQGPTSQAARRLVRDDLDPHYGLHNWQVSVQIHTFGRNIWNRTFKQVFWNERESIPGEKAVLLLVSHHEVFPGVLKLPWKSEAFSGSLRGVYLLDITLWDGGGEIAWQHTSVARINPAPLVVVEYGIDFDGEQVYTHIMDIERGVNVALNMCIPMNITYQQANNERPMIAITNLQIGLTVQFLEEWCGAANI